MLSSEQNPEECDATDDAICTSAGNIKIKIFLPRHGIKF
jgi:hypothetical protein